MEEVESEDSEDRDISKKINDHMTDNQIKDEL
jgi:hypothetical protein